MAEPKEQTIGIFACAFPDVGPWDPHSLESGIPGAEETVLFMAEELARLGYKITVFGDPPPDSVYSAPHMNPRYLPTRFHEAKDFDAETERFDIAISWRMPDISVFLRKVAKEVYFWPHDPCYRVVQQETIDDFDDVLWLSHWQREQWCSVSPGFAQYTHIFGNGIIEDSFHPIQERKNPYSCIYGSSYGKGLSVLLDAWPTVKRLYPRATLDICYGWKHWGSLTSDDEKKLRNQISHLEVLGVKEHGRVGQKQLTDMFESASFWTYPCTVPETFCITALRAQYAGAIPVIIDAWALQETVRYGWACSDQDEYLNTMLKAFKHAETISVSDRATMRTFIHDNFTWKHIAARWKTLFDQNNDPKYR